MDAGWVARVTKEVFYCVQYPKWLLNTIVGWRLSYLESSDSLDAIHGQHQRRKRSIVCRGIPSCASHSEGSRGCSGVNFPSLMMRISFAFQAVRRVVTQLFLLAFTAERCVRTYRHFRVVFSFREPAGHCVAPQILIQLLLSVGTWCSVASLLWKRPSAWESDAPQNPKIGIHPFPSFIWSCHPVGTASEGVRFGVQVQCKLNGRQWWGCGCVDPK